MNNIAVGNTPSGLRIGEQKEKRTRNRTSAQRTASRNRQTLSSSEVEEFNRQEVERERDALRKRIGGVKSFGSESPLLSLMAAIAGYLNWYQISGHPVEISIHTERGRKMRRPRACAS